MADMGTAGAHLIRFLRDEPTISLAGAELPTLSSKVDLRAFARLALAAPAVVSKAELARVLYGDAYDASMHDAGLESAMLRLRKRGLPITKVDYSLELASADVDILDFDARSKVFNDRLADPHRVEASDYLQHRRWAIRRHLHRRDSRLLPQAHPRRCRQ